MCGRNIEIYRYQFLSLSRTSEVLMIQQQWRKEASPTAITSETLWLAQKGHMARLPMVTFHSHNFRAVLSYILYGTPPWWVKGLRNGENEALVFVLHNYIAYRNNHSWTYSVPYNLGLSILRLPFVITPLVSATTLVFSIYPSFNFTLLQFKTTFCWLNGWS